jgi:hypothetical protein
MTDADLAKLRAHFAKMRSELNTPEKARAYLVEHGFLRPEGGLTEAYGGLPTAETTETTISEQ